MKKSISYEDLLALANSRLKGVAVCEGVTVEAFARGAHGSLTIDLSVGGRISDTRSEPCGTAVYRLFQQLLETHEIEEPK